MLRDGEVVDERGRPQTDNDDPNLALDIGKLEWYAYNENYGTSEEKQFVKFMAGQVERLFEVFKDAEIFLIRNESEYWIYAQNGRRFAPDYLLLINDWKNRNFYYQCIFEPKGGHLLEMDRWKEEMLESLEKNASISFDVREGDKKEYGKYLTEVKKTRI